MSTMNSFLTTKNDKEHHVYQIIIVSNKPLYTHT